MFSYFFVRFYISIVRSGSSLIDIKLKREAVIGCGCPLTSRVILS